MESDRRHGWTADTTTIADVQRRVAAFLQSRGWPACHDPKSLTMSIAIEAAELMELFQWTASEQADLHGRDPERVERIREELADVIIYCFSLSHRLGIDVAAALDDKIVKNGRKYPPLPASREPAAGA